MRSMLKPRRFVALDFFPFFVLSAIFVAGTIFWIFFALGERERSQEYFRFSVERLADQLLRRQMMMSLSGETFPENVLGFGVFDEEGKALNRWGQAPESIIPPAEGSLRPFSSLTPRGDDIFEFEKALDPSLGRRMGPPPPNFNDRENGMGDDAMHPGFRNMRRPPVSSSSAPLFNHPWSRESFVFLRLLQPRVEAVKRGWFFGLFAGPVVWGGILYWVGYLWYRSRRFERDLDKSRELMSFVEASRTLSHEIRNPLSAILLQTALLDRNREEVKIIEEEVRRISRLVERVRDFLRDAKGRPEPQNVWSALSSLRERFSVHFALRPAENPDWTVNFDEIRFRSVLENLLKNAFESAPDPTVEAVLSQTKSGWIRVEILDDGSGLGSDAKKRAFTPFFTTKIQGSGIGLAVSRRFTEAAGGRLTLENRPEGGARAILEIPRTVGGGP